MNIKHSLSIATIATVFCVATYVSAQVQLDTRTRRTEYYNPRGGSDQGHALDRNPQLGSNGRNSVAGGGSYTEYTNNPGAFTDITRSRGLSEFHGNAPTINNTFRGNSETRGTANFDRQSVSVADVVGNQASIYRPQDSGPFYGQGEAVMTLGQAIRANTLNVAPIPGNDNPTVDMARQNSMNQLNEDMTPQQSRQLKSLIYLQGTPYSNAVINSVPGNIPAPTSAKDLIQMQQALDRIGYAQGAFGQTNPYDRTTLANEITQFDAAEQQTDQRNNMVNAQVNNGPIEMGSPITSIDASPITGKPPVRDDFYVQDSFKDKTATDAKEVAPLPADDKMGFNQDAFHDVVVALQQKAADERNAKELQRKEEQEKEAAELDKVLDKNADKTVEQEELNNLSLKTDKEQRRQMLVELDTKHDVVLKNLAGNSRDLFNRYMNSAKQALAKGRYYAASQQYELAVRVNGKNPLPWIGGSLAKFAASEWSVAGFRLQMALEMYPQLMDVKLDLKSLLPGLDVQQQLNLLENWMMAIEPQPNILLLAAYMQYQAGNLAGARRHAESMINYPTKISSGLKLLAEEIIKKTNSIKEK